MEEYQYILASEYMDGERSTTYCDITMKNMIYVQVVECHQKLNKPLTKLLIKVSIKYIISNAMCYTILSMLELMRKRKHRIGTPRTRGLCGSTLTAYIHGGIP